MTPPRAVRPVGAVTRVCYASRASPRRGRPIRSDTGLGSGSRGEPHLRREGDLLHAPGGGGQRRPARRAAAIRRLQSVVRTRSEEHTSELQSPCNLVCRLLLEKKNNTPRPYTASNRR